MPSSQKKASAKQNEVVEDVAERDEAPSTVDAGPCRSKRIPAQKTGKSKPESSKGKRTGDSNEKAVRAREAEPATSTRSSKRGGAPKKNRVTTKGDELRGGGEESRSSEMAVKKDTAKTPKCHLSGNPRKTTAQRPIHPESPVRRTVKTRTVLDSETLGRAASSTSSTSVKTELSAKPGSGDTNDKKKTRLSSKTTNPPSSRKANRESAKKLLSARKTPRSPSSSVSDTPEAPKITGKRKKAHTSSRPSNQAQNSARYNAPKLKAEQKRPKPGKTSSPARERKQTRAHKRQRVESKSSTSPGPSNKVKRVSIGKNVDAQTRSGNATTSPKVRTKELKTITSKGRKELGRSSSRSSLPKDKKKSRISKSNDRTKMNHIARPAPRLTEKTTLKTAPQKERRTTMASSQSTGQKEYPKESSRSKAPDSIKSRRVSKFKNKSTSINSKNRCSVTSTVRGKKTLNPALLKGRRKVTRASSQSTRSREFHQKKGGKKAMKPAKPDSVLSLSDASRSISSSKSEPASIIRASAIRSPGTKKKVFLPRSSSAPAKSDNPQIKITSLRKGKLGGKVSTVKTSRKCCREKYEEGNDKPLRESEEKSTSIKSHRAAALKTSVETQAETGDAGTCSYVVASPAERFEGLPQDPKGVIYDGEHHKRKMGEHSPHHDSESAQGGDGGKGEYREWSLKDPKKEDCAPEKQDRMVRESSPLQQGAKKDHRMSGLKDGPPQDAEVPKEDESPKNDGSFCTVS